MPAGILSSSKGPQPLGPWSVAKQIKGSSKIKMGVGHQRREGPRKRVVTLTEEETEVTGFRAGPSLQTSVFVEKKPVKDNKAKNTD